MAIAALPEATVHLLGSAQALTTPTSLVKELIDNGLDAKATSIDILISQNTIDKIEVRDNGHGIPQQDLDALGRRGHTSKLRSFDDLKAIGGVSLGFRGEALASAVQLGEVSVTSRTDADPVATTVKLKAPGGIESQSRKSHPIGTTVCVLKFLEKIPVRKQTTLKAAPKTLVKVKELLQSYALSRPSVRFTLKVIKGAKGSWSFAPRPNDGIKEAVSQVIGRDAAAQCMEKSLAFSESQSVEANASESLTEKHQLLNDQFLVEVFLPRPDADPSKFGHGQFISVDSRPVSHEKGTMKRIVTIFKHCLKAAFGDGSEVKNPFLRLSITCPVASYDPNVEPAKDDILFSNEYIVLEAIEGLFRTIYGESKQVSAIEAPHPLVQKLDNFELLLARKPVESSTNHIQSSPSETGAPMESPNGLLVPSLPSPINSDPVMGTDNLTQSIEASEDEAVGNRRKWGFDMSKDFTEEDRGPARANHPSKFRSPRPAEKSAPTTTSSNPLNPWLIAKMVAPVQQDNHNKLPTPSDSHNLAAEPSETSTQISSQLSDPMLLDLSHSEIPNASRLPRRRYSNEILRNPNHSIADTLPFQHHNQPQRRYSNEDMRGGRPPLGATDYDELFIAEEQAPQVRRRNDFISAKNLPENAFVSPPATQRLKGAKRSNGVNKPFAPPRTIARNTIQSDGFRQSTLLDGYPAPNGNRQEIPQMEANPELEWAMDYEQRKEKATQHHRQERGKSRRARADSFQGDPGERARSSPHKNRYISAIKALEADAISSQNSARVVGKLKTTLADEDPRAYFMKQQKLMAVPNGGPLKLSRAKSMKLPLERIPNNSQTHELLLTLATNTDRLRSLMMNTAKDDTYSDRGSQPTGLSIDASSMPALTSRIQDVVENWMDAEEERRCEVEYKFGNLLGGGLSVA
ncbi:PMS1 protein-like protein [Lachnellula subtilissima]|uniref:PMS1 protein-like protein n=1 Tax=Lachnellula subtilissima TaxID=602034 RepID=A0A8H8RUJ8_9HELO|nr:PMS1 protein-like protein [Lachnellula subtilissima]